MVAIEVSEDEFDQLTRQIERRKRERADKMPSAREALVVAFEAFQRFEDMGFRHIMHGPRDGTEVEVIEFGSTGIFIASYSNGTWWIQDAGDLRPSTPVMFRRGPFVDRAPAEPTPHERGDGKP